MKSNRWEANRRAGVRFPRSEQENEKKGGPTEGPVVQIARHGGPLFGNCEVEDAERKRFEQNWGW